MKKTHFIIFCLFLFACKKPNEADRTPTIFKIEVDLKPEGSSVLSLDSGFVIATRNEQKIRKNFTITGPLAEAALPEVKEGEWKIEAYVYAKDPIITKAKVTLLHKKVTQINASAKSLKLKCPKLPISTLKTVPLEGWELFRLQYLATPKITYTLPYFSDNPSVEFEDKENKWTYFYMDRVYYRKVTGGHQELATSVAETTKNTLGYNKSTLLKHNDIPSILNGLTWDEVHSQLILLNETTGDEAIFYFGWDVPSAE